MRSDARKSAHNLQIIALACAAQYEYIWLTLDGGWLIMIQRMIGLAQEQMAGSVGVSFASVKRWGGSLSSYGRKRRSLRRD